MVKRFYVNVYVVSSSWTQKSLKWSAHGVLTSQFFGITHHQYQASLT